MKRFFAGCAAALLLAFSSACYKSRPYGPPRDSVYRIGLNASWVSLDPMTTSDVYSSVVQCLAYETLYEFDFLKPGSMIPGLAAEMPKVSKDFKTFEFKLKQGVMFQDDPCFPGGKGREFNAEDVAYHFRRIADKKLSSPSYSAYEGVVAGIDDFRNGKAATISGVEVVDRYTVRVKLLKPQPRFIFNFVSRGAGLMVPEECVKHYGDRIAEHAVGTGPFRILKYSPQEVVAERNPTYRKSLYPDDGSEDAGKQLPFVDKVVILSIKEDQPRWLNFMAGELEQIGVPKDNMPQAVVDGKISDELKAKGMQLFTQVKSDIVVQLFNLDDPVWGKKKELREAFALARNVPETITTMYSGMAIPAHTLLSPGDYGYDPKYVSHLSKRDVARAKELLAKAGYPGGRGLPPIQWPSTSSATSRQSYELLQRQLDDVGIKLQFEPMAWPEFSKRLKEGKFTLASMGWSGDVPDADSALPMFHSRSMPPGGQDYVRYKNPAYDKLVEEIETMGNGPSRYRKIRQALKMLEDDLAIIPVVHRIGAQLYQPWVKHASFADELYIAPFLKYRRVVPGKEGQ